MIGLVHVEKTTEVLRLSMASQCQYIMSHVSCRARCVTSVMHIHMQLCVLDCFTEL